MAAYLIGHITIRDQEKWEIYTAGVKKSLQPVQAEVVFRGKPQSVLAGRHDYDQTVVIRFSDHAELQRWFNSEAYQLLVPIRDSAADVVIITYDP